jgi:hypothetical protein
VDKGQILEREARWARPVALATIAAVALFLGSVILEQFADLIDTKNDATKLISYHDHGAALAATAAMRTVGALLLIPVLYHLYRAAQARTDPQQARRRRNLAAFAFIGPVFLALESIVAWIGFHGVADKFVEQAGGALNGNLAENLIDDSGTIDAATALFLPAILGLLIAMVFISLIAMRAGLLTRFTGTLGMALGAALLLLGPSMLIAALIWFLYVGLMIGGRLPSGRPPAWAAGESVPWPVPERGSGLFGSGRGAPPPEGVIEGSGQEVEAGNAETAEPAAIEPGPGVETQGQRRKKRKRRG